MSSRLPQEGSRINREKTVDFRFNGKNLKGFYGDTVASALLANNEMFVARSFKYHRPRGIFSAGEEEPNALMEQSPAGRPVFQLACQLQDRSLQVQENTSSWCGNR